MKVTEKLPWFFVVALLGLCAWVYISGNMALQKAVKEAQGYLSELSQLKESLFDAERKVAVAALEASRLSQAEKDRRYAEIKDAGTAAAIAVATATLENDDEADPDRPLPLSLAEQRWVQHERICAAGSCGFPESAFVRAKADADAQGQERTAHNGKTTRARK